MVRSEIFVFPRENGERQRVQLIRPDSWESLSFFRPVPEPARAFLQITTLFEDFIVPRYPWLYGQLVFFRLPEDLPLPGEPADLSESSRLALAAEIFRRGLTVHRRQPRFSTPDAKQLYSALSDVGCVQLVSGKRPRTSILPVTGRLGFLSSCAPENALVSNLSFFLMDPLDLATARDFMGVPIGLRVKNGVIESAPQFSRPMLLIRKDGSVCVSVKPGEHPVTFSVNGHKLCRINEHTRFPAPKSGGKTILTIVDGRVADLSGARRVPVPTSGFTAALKEESPESLRDIRIGDPVALAGMEDVLFGVQVGPAAVIGGKPVYDVPEPFWHIKRVPENLLFSKAPYPPALYPYDPIRDRAPRMVLGADASGKPMLLFFEGAAKHGHIPGEDSCGASLLETARVCVELGMRNGVHLDGGGSAQILQNGKRALLISDRDRTTFAETERAVPTGLMIV